jgi:hypothetical protein
MPECRINKFTAPAKVYKPVTNRETSLCDADHRKRGELRWVCTVACLCSIVASNQEKDNPVMLPSFGLTTVRVPTARLQRHPDNVLASVFFKVAVRAVVPFSQRYFSPSHSLWSRAGRQIQCAVLCDARSELAVPCSQASEARKQPRTCLLRETALRHPTAASRHLHSGCGGV